MREFNTLHHLQFTLCLVWTFEDVGSQLTSTVNHTWYLLSCFSTTIDSYPFVTVIINSFFEKKLLIVLLLLQQQNNYYTEFKDFIYNYPVFNAMGLYLCTINTVCDIYYFKHFLTSFTFTHVPYCCINSGELLVLWKLLAIMLLFQFPHAT